MGRKFCRAGAPAEIGTGEDVIHPGRPIPRRIQIPLHVGIVGKELAIPIEGGVVGIAESRRENLPGFPFGIDFGDVTDGRGHALHEVGAARKKLVFPPQFRNARVGEVLGELGLITHHHDQIFAIRGEHDGVRAVLATCGVELLDSDDFVEDVVLVGIEQPEDSRAGLAAP